MEMKGQLHLVTRMSFLVGLVHLKIKTNVFSSTGKPEDKHGFRKARRLPVEGRREAEAASPEQLWYTNAWIWFDYLTRMCFSLSVLVVCQHLRWPQQYPNYPGTCSANSRRSATSHSWKAHFAMEFSAVKGSRCFEDDGARVLKRCQIFTKTCQVLEGVP